MSREVKPDLFWSKVEKSDGCWLWTAAVSRNGYGRFNGGYLAHRFAYELVNGKIPDGMQLDHLCRVRHCVNPDHLEPVTQQENIRRGRAGRLNNHCTAKTHCPHGHPYDDENTYRYNGRRECRTCRRERSRQ